MRNQITESEARAAAVRSMESTSVMLNHLLEVQRTLVLRGDTMKIEIVEHLTNMLHDEYLEAAEIRYDL